MTLEEIDRIVAQWSQRLPDMDPEAIEVSKRMWLLATLMQKAETERLKSFNLDRGEFDVIVTLFREGPPFKMNPTVIFKSLMISSGGLTARLDRLEKMGLIRRDSDPEDRRGILVELTAKGRALTERAVRTYLGVGQDLVAPLTSKERKELASLLRKLAPSFSNPE